jgi:serine/threonine protein kinase
MEQIKQAESSIITTAYADEYTGLISLWPELHFIFSKELIQLNINLKIEEYYQLKLGECYSINKKDYIFLGEYTFNCIALLSSDSHQIKMLKWEKKDTPASFNRRFLTYSAFCEGLAHVSTFSFYDKLDKESTYDNAKKIVAQSSKRALFTVFFMNNDKKTLLVKRAADTKEMLYEVHAVLTLQQHKQHPYIIKYLKPIIYNQSLAIVMKIYEDYTIENWIDKHVLFSEAPPLEHLQLISSLIKKLLEGITFIHSIDVIHMDIKPANILFDKESASPRIFDFGLAQKNNRFLRGSTMGSPLYMSPEFFNPNTIDTLTANPTLDSYSLGLTFLSILYKCIPLNNMISDPDTFAVYRENPNKHPFFFFKPIKRTNDKNFESMIDGLINYDASKRLTPKDALTTYFKTKYDGFFQEEDKPKNAISLNQNGLISSTNKKSFVDSVQSFFKGMLHLDGVGNTSSSFENAKH